jgi:NAD+ kinase
MTTFSPFKRLGLVGKPAHSLNLAGRSALTAVATWLSAHCQTCWLETDTAAAIAYSGNSASLSTLPTHVDAIIVVGGDGTMLAVARELAHFQTPLIGINQGHLGFMTDIAQASFASDLQAVLAGDYTIEPRSMIMGSLLRNGTCIATALALNDAVISRGASSSMVDVSVAVDGRTAYRLRADGLVVATPTGSTAYSLSANGPIVHPSVTGFVLVPVAPQTLSNRPIVLPETSIIDVLIEPSRSEGMVASFDMQQWQSLQSGDTIRLQKSPHTTQLVHPRAYDYYHTLRQKLHWTYNPVSHLEL